MERFTDEFKDAAIENGLCTEIEGLLERLLPYLVASSDGFLMSPVTKLP